ncbi:MULTISPECIES: hypothetical protein [unclassified Halomonas]|uniref:hypothetical protein n=1 Tax=unclassified Halomonas TaxID=2609666 RepID=UPI0020767A5F|nr:MULTISPECIES: hypothetical protein [unclassified Halomonas]
MFHKNENHTEYRFFQEALPLLSTYFSGESVEIANVNIPAGQDSDDESLKFVDQIRFRHAIASCTSLIPIVHKIEGQVSNLTDTLRKETKGEIRGRLDIQRYMARRISTKTWPRTYPVLVTTTKPNTPENRLVVQLFRILLSRLHTNTHPLNYSESKLGQSCRNWIRARLRSEPWVDVSGSSSIQRLFLEASRRTARRQTGNDYSYLELIKFIKDWKLLGEDIAGGPSSNHFINSMFAFPTDQSFMDRIYEIWCIRQIGQALTTLGATLLDGPHALYQNRKYPIYDFELEGDRIRVFFQRSLPHENARWAYTSTSAKIRAIPDIIVIANEVHYIIFDAKNRLVTGSTRSEETYKMLGYFENFNSILKGKSNWGVLAFTSNDLFRRTLVSDNGRRLELISAHPKNPTKCGFSSDVRSIINEWLKSWKS